MRLVRFRSQGRTCYGVYTSGGVRPIIGDPFSGIVEGGRLIALDEIKLLAPVEPTKIVGVGLNYSDHAHKLGLPLPSQPIIFLKAPSTILEPGGSVVYPSQSNRVEYEAELAVVIGTEARFTGEEEALTKVLGY